MNNHSFKLGLALGLTGKPLPIGKPEPVAFLYNGVRLPKLPEWDREMYPYAVIQGIFMVRSLIVSKEPWYCTGEKYPCGDKVFSNTEVNTSEAIYWHCTSNYSIWTYTGELVQDADNRKMAHKEDADGDGTIDTAGYFFVWSNHDVIDTDGSVFYTASDPIPVYE